MGILHKMPTRKGPAKEFTGDVWIDDIAIGEGPWRLRVSIVRFCPGARSAWHYHPCGQTLHLIDGVGLVQSGGVGQLPSGGEVIEIQPGHTIFTPQRVWHWHGAAPDHFMAHFSITQSPKEGLATDWAHHVTDEEYARAWHVRSSYRWMAVVESVDVETENSPGPV